MIAASFLVFFLLTGCSTPIGVSRCDNQEWMADSSDTSLTSDKVSRRARDYLLKRGLWREFQKEPKFLLERLANEFRKTRDMETLVALIELCYHYADQGPKKDRMMAHLSAAYFAYFSLFVEDLKELRSPYEMRFIINCRFYNHSVAEVLKEMQERGFPLDKGFESPIMGGMTVSFSPAVSDLPLPLPEYKTFLSCFDYLPDGLRTYTRQTGLGAPLIPIKKKADDESLNVVGNTSGGMFPATLFMRFPNVAQPEDKIQGVLEFVDTTKTEQVKVGESKVPLELDISTPLAYYLKASPDIVRGLYYLLNPGKMEKLQGVYMITPYDPKKIPVVFVHGLISSPRTWAQMYNTIMSDPEIRSRYQFWYFAYPTGNPIAYSAQLLRKGLEDVRRKHDPDGANPNFNRMVLVSHSMGGLLSKQMIMNTDPEIIEKVFKVPLDRLDITAEQKSFIMDMYVHKSLPFVSMVVFIATPHRGSGMAAWTVTRWVSSMITVQDRIVEDMRRISKSAMVEVGLKEENGVTAEPYGDDFGLDNQIMMSNLQERIVDDVNWVGDSALVKIGLKEMDEVMVKTGLENLDPNNKMIKILSETPLDKAVGRYSIIGDTSGPGVVDRTDGIVPYESSHLDGVDSEAVLRGDHHVHQEPAAAAEVIQILRGHLRGLESKPAR